MVIVIGRAFPSYLPVQVSIAKRLDTAEIRVAALESGKDRICLIRP
jgi:hypothetical protein